ncbi:MAG TPA: squalene/phytoene synthase family protein, partial [Stellaceae bacterium]|nr:squalene/phytoene synthase family protein [Stellaceae bacterium]
MLSLDSPAVERIRRHDRDRFLATLFAPAAHRPALWALLAFNLEVARVRETVTQPMLGQIRLAWWREAVAEAYGDGPVRRHEVATPLAEAIRAHAIRRERLDALIDGRERDLDPTPPATMDELLAYAEATSTRLIEAQLDVLGADSAVAGPAGIAWALIGLMRAVPFHAASYRSWIPDDVAGEAGLGADARFAPS